MSSKNKKFLILFIFVNSICQQHIAHSDDNNNNKIKWVPRNIFFFYTENNEDDENLRHVLYYDSLLLAIKHHFKNKFAAKTNIYSPCQACLEDNLVKTQDKSEYASLFTLSS